MDADDDDPFAALDAEYDDIRTELYGRRAIRAASGVPDVTWLELGEIVYVVHDDCADEELLAALEQSEEYDP
jgi:hypothetical protein